MSSVPVGEYYIILSDFNAQGMMVTISGVEFWIRMDMKQLMTLARNYSPFIYM